MNDDTEQLDRILFATCGMKFSWYNIYAHSLQFTSITYTYCDISIYSVLYALFEQIVIGGTAEIDL